MLQVVNYTDKGTDRRKIYPDLFYSQEISNSKMKATILPYEQ